MKKLLTALAFTALAASTAFAKTTHASATPAVDPYVVISFGQVVGRDPDINIRFDLMREGAVLAN